MIIDIANAHLKGAYEVRPETFAELVPFPCDRICKTPRGNKVSVFFYKLNPLDQYTLMNLLCVRFQTGDIIAPFKSMGAGWDEVRHCAYLEFLYEAQNG